MLLQQSHETDSLLAYIQTGCHVKPSGTVGNPWPFACTGPHSLADLAAIIDCRPPSHNGLLSGLASFALAWPTEISFVRHNRHAAALAQPGTAPIDGTAEVCVRGVIKADAEIGSGWRIGPAVVIGKGVVLGPDCRIGSRLSISHALLGARVYVYPGARIGQEGFGFDVTPQGFRTVRQLGCVILENDVEIGANITIDRGALDAT